MMCATDILYVGIKSIFSERVMLGLEVLAHSEKAYS